MSTRPGAAGIGGSTCTFGFITASPTGVGVGRRETSIGLSQFSAYDELAEIASLRVAQRASAASTPPACTAQAREPDDRLVGGAREAPGAQVISITLMPSTSPADRAEGYVAATGRTRGRGDGRSPTRRPADPVARDSSVRDRW